MLDDDEKQSDAAAIIAAMEKYHDAKQITIEDADGDRKLPLLLVPNGFEIKSVKPYVNEYLERPEFRRGVAKLYDLKSLAAHAKRFKTPHAVAFANNNKTPSITVVYDYHEAHTDEGDGEPDWLRHRALYEFPLSDPWKAWTACTEPMSQAEFAAFLEDHIADVADVSQPSETLKSFAEQLAIDLVGPAKLMAIARGLSLRVDIRASQSLNLTSGESQITFSEEHQPSEASSMKVPGGFAIQIPVFRNGALYNIPVRLRYRLAGQRFVWWLSLHNIDRVLQHAIDEACNDFHHDTEIPLLYGSPEA